MAVFCNEHFMLYIYYWINYFCTLKCLDVFLINKNVWSFEDLWFMYLWQVSVENCIGFVADLIYHWYIKYDFDYIDH